MALNKQNFFVNFAKGVDSGRDPKTVIPSKFTKLDNLEWDKFQTVRQRPGYSAATITAHTGSSAVLNIRQLHTLGAELLLEAQSGFHAFAQDHTVNRDTVDGTTTDLKQLERGQIDYTPVANGQRPVYELDAAAASPSGLECWAWAEDFGTGATEIRYQVVDGKTRTVIQEGSVAGAAGSLGAVGPRVLVRNAAGVSKFYIYYRDASDGVQMKSLTVASGAKVPGALTASALAPNLATGTFDAWYDPTTDKIALAYEDNVLDLYTAILSGSDGATILNTRTKLTITSVVAVSVTIVNTFSSAFMLVVYSDGVGTEIRAYSTLLDSTSPVATVLTSGTTTSGALVTGGRLTVLPNPFVASSAMVFFDTSYTAGGYAPFFPIDIGYVQCGGDGSTPVYQSVFARGVKLAARPVGYASGASTDVCVTAVLPSTIQPTMFMLKFGGLATASAGCGTIAAGTHVPPRVLARILPGECALIQTGRLPTPMAVVT